MGRPRPDANPQTVTLITGGAPDPPRPRPRPAPYRLGFAAVGRVRP